jgi:hypothetical protein
MMDHSCFEKRTMHARILMVALAAITVAILAYADTGSSPYAGQQTRAIKALSSEDIEELRTGAGMGMFGHPNGLLGSWVVSSWPA